MQSMKWKGLNFQFYLNGTIFSECSELFSRDVIENDRITLTLKSIVTVITMLKSKQVNIDFFYRNVFCNFRHFSSTIYSGYLEPSIYTGVFLILGLNSELMPVASFPTDLQ